LGYLLHFSPGAARDLVARYVTALAPGSYVVLSVGRGEEQPVHLRPRDGQALVGVARVG